MAVSYKRLFKLLIDRDMKKKDLCQIANVSPATIAKMKNGDNVMVEVLERICLSLHCNIEDIVEIIPDKSPKKGITNKENTDEVNMYEREE